MRNKKQNVGDLGQTQEGVFRNCIYYNKVNMATSSYPFSLYTQHANSWIRAFSVLRLLYTYTFFILLFLRPSIARTKIQPSSRTKRVCIH